VSHEAATNADEQGGTTPDVLIVEDERISRRALAMLLESCGYKPAAYESAEEALQHIKNSPPLVMLVDLDLPGMSGIDLIKQLRQLNPALQAVLITAAEGDQVAKFRRENEVDYLRKPVNFDRLLQLLQHFGLHTHEHPH
jgi:CheY-like chemotaxis protein